MINKTTDPEQIKKAIALLNEVLMGEVELARALRKALMKTHPDKGGDEQSFKIINDVYDDIKPFLNDKKLTNIAKLNLASTLRVLPTPTRNLLMERIQKAHPGISNSDLEKPSVSVIRSTFYSHQNFNPLEEGRFHAFKASADSLSAKYEGLSGDFLKSKILLDFKEKLENTSSKNELQDVVRDIKSSEEYKVLSKGQGVTTRFFNLKTSSVKAFEDMVKEQEKNVDLPQTEHKKIGMVQIQ